MRGEYALHIVVEGRAVGDFPFSVKGVRIQLQGRQVRDATDPLTFIADYTYGGKYTSSWFARTGAATAGR